MKTLGATAVVTLAFLSNIFGETASVSCPTASTCRNGNCVVNAAGAETCDCGNYFSGTSCEIVRLDVPDWTITATTVSFEWPTNITLTGYEFACYRKYVSNPSVLSRNVTGNPFDTLTFTGLIAGANIYVICLVDSSSFDVSDPDKFTTTLNKDNANCFSFSTMYDGRDPFTLAAYGIAIMIGTIFMLSLIVKFCFDIRQNKIRLKEKGLKSLTKFTSKWIGGGRDYQDSDDDNASRRGEVGKPSVSHVDRILLTSASSPNLLLSRDELTGRSASSGDIRASGRKARTIIAADKRSIGSQGSRGSVPRKSNSNIAVLMNMKDSLGQGQCHSGSRPSVLDMEFEGHQNQSRSQSVPGIDMM